MGNNLQKESKVTLEEEMFMDNDYYKYNPNEDVFELKIKFFSVPGIKSALHYISMLSSIDAIIQKNYDPNCDDHGEVNYFTIIEIEGITSNIFKFAEWALSNAILIYAFQEILKYENKFDSHNNTVVWKSERLAKVKILQSVSTYKNKFLQTAEQQIELFKQEHQIQIKNKFSPVDKNEEEEKKNEQLKIKDVNSKISNSSGSKKTSSEVQFIVQIPQVEKLARIFKMDFYQNNPNFTIFAPIQKLMNLLYTDKKYKTITLLSLISDEQVKQNINLLKMDQEMKDMKKQQLEMMKSQQEILDILKKKLN